VQLDELVNVGCSASERRAPGCVSLSAFSRLRSYVPGRPSGSLFRLNLTDGVQRFTGFEYSPLERLDARATPAGVKCLLTHPHVRRGQLLLTPLSFRLLGGKVARLEAAKAAALAAWDQPPEVAALVQRRARRAAQAAGGVAGERRSRTEAAQAAAWAAAPGMAGAAGHPPPQQQMQPQMQQPPQQQQQQPPPPQQPLAIDDDEDLPLVQAYRAADAQRPPPAAQRQPQQQPPPPQPQPPPQPPPPMPPPRAPPPAPPVTAPQPAPAAAPPASPWDRVSGEPFTYLSSLLSRLAASGPAAEPVLLCTASVWANLNSVVQCHFKGLREYKSTIVIEDGSASVTARLHSPVLEAAFGGLPVELEAALACEARGPAARERVVGFQQAMAAMVGRMEVQLWSGCQPALVVTSLPAPPGGPGGNGARAHARALLARIAQNGRGS